MTKLIDPLSLSCDYTMAPYPVAQCYTPIGQAKGKKCAVIVPRARTDSGADAELLHILLVGTPQTKVNTRAAA